MLVPIAAAVLLGIAAVVLVNLIKPSPLWLLQLDPNAPPLAPAASADRPNGDPIDGIECVPYEQLKVHRHVLLILRVDGSRRSVPEGVGFVPPLLVSGSGSQRVVSGGRCEYWLHTHAQDGVIHVEAPAQRTFVLGEFFDIWGQPLQRDRLGPLQGRLSATVNGSPWRGELGLIPLEDGNEVELDLATAT